MCLDMKKGLYQFLIQPLLCVKLKLTILNYGLCKIKDAPKVCPVGIAGLGGAKPLATML